MNRERMMEVADIIEAHPDNFFMGVYCSSTELSKLSECGSHGCIAGWTVFLYQYKKPVDKFVPGWDIHERARWLLGLTNKEAEDLFYARVFPNPEYLDDAQWTADYLRRCAAAGEILKVENA